VTWTLVNSATANFADGNTGHVYTLPSGAPSAGDLDILFVNSDTTVTTPSGFTLPTNGSFVNSQGAYGYYRIATGGEGSTVTVTTNGNFDTDLIWQRWQGASSFDVAANAHVDGSTGSSTPAVSTGTLASNNDLIAVFAALHTPGGSAATAPSWSSGYTNDQLVSRVAVAGISGYKTGAGTASESPSVSWTNDYFDRYVIVLTFTPSVAGGSAPTAVTASPPRLPQLGRGVVLAPTTGQVAAVPAPPALTTPVKPPPLAGRAIVLAPYGPVAAVPAPPALVVSIQQLQSSRVLIVQPNPDPGTGTPANNGPSAVVVTVVRPPAVRSVVVAPNPDSGLMAPPASLVVTRPLIPQTTSLVLFPPVGLPPVPSTGPSSLVIAAAIRPTHRTMVISPNPDPGSVSPCITPRPFSGITHPLAGGTTVRPDTGVTQEPC
jgi:hypothetical protein